MATIAIYNMRLAGFLMLNGFVLIDTKLNDNGSGKRVFIFKDTPELKAAMQNYLDSKSTK